MNRKNPAVKRIMADVKELQTHPSSRYFAQPLEDNMFEWHFTIRGPADTPFAEGIYHGRILLPVDYPMKPPNIVFLTKNGRFEVGTKICLSISAYHEESWQPAWGIRTMLEAIISFLPSEGMGAIGALDWTAEERRKLAIESQKYCCSLCGNVAALLSDPADNATLPDTKPSAEEGTESKQANASGSTTTNTTENMPEQTVRETLNAVSHISAPSTAEHTDLKSSNMIHTEETTLTPCTPVKARSNTMEDENIALKHPVSGEKSCFSGTSFSSEDYPVHESTGLRQRHIDQSHYHDTVQSAVHTTPTHHHQQQQQSPARVALDNSSQPCSPTHSAHKTADTGDAHICSQHSAEGTQNRACSSSCEELHGHTMQQQQQGDDRQHTIPLIQHTHTVAVDGREQVNTIHHTDSNPSDTTVLPVAAQEAHHHLNQAAAVEVAVRQPGDLGAEAVNPDQGMERDIVDEWLTVLLVAIGTSIGLMLWRIVLRYYTLFFL